MILKLLKNYFVREQGYFNSKDTNRECTIMYYHVTCYDYYFLFSAKIAFAGDFALE